jgi:hypothetical protein
MSAYLMLMKLYEIPIETSVRAVFSCFKVQKILQDSPLHRIFGRMHGALNIGKNN